MQTSVDFVKNMSQLNSTDENKAQLQGFFEIYEFFRPLCKIVKIININIVISEDIPPIEDRLSIAI